MKVRIRTNSKRGSKGLKPLRKRLSTAKLNKHKKHLADKRVTKQVTTRTHGSIR